MARTVLICVLDVCVGWIDNLEITRHRNERGMGVRRASWYFSIGKWHRFQGMLSLLIS